MTRQSAKLLLGLGIAAAIATLAAVAGLSKPAVCTAAITALCAAYWVTEALPIPATSLIPYAALPLTGVLDHKTVAQAYGHYLILLLLGGFILSKAIESSGAHRRLALGMVRAFGGFGRRGLVLGFMVATAASSMWISNTATVLMMLPIITAVLTADEEGDLQIPLLLGVAYAASIGGIGTPIGTPPNVLFMSVYNDQSGHDSIAFVEWMSWGIPIVLVMVPLAWLIVTRRVTKGPIPKLPTTGAWSAPERRVVVLFAFTAVAWIFRANPYGGWSGLVGLVDASGRPTIGDETVALAAVSLCFVLPDGGGSRMLTWDRAKEIPWGLLLLFGGGLAIAKAFEVSGLSSVLGDALQTLGGGEPLLVVGLICLVVTFTTELTSNTATTSLLMPILCAAGLAAGVDPRGLMIPAAVSASCAFMMPVATAPNAVVFGTERVPIGAMVRNGLWLNLLGALVITLVTVALV